MSDLNPLSDVDMSINHGPVGAPHIHTHFAICKSNKAAYWSILIGAVFPRAANVPAYFFRILKPNFIYLLIFYQSIIQPWLGGLCTLVCGVTNLEHIHYCFTWTAMFQTIT